MNRRWAAWFWRVALFAAVVLGVLLVASLSPGDFASFYHGIVGSGDSRLSNPWAIPAGYAYALIGGQLIALVTGKLLKKWHAALDNPDPSDRWVAVMVGVLERTLYVSALLGGYTAFIPLWLGLKVAGWWKGAAEDDIRPARTAFFSSFLMGSGLSVAYAGVGFLSIGLLQDGQWERAVVSMASLVVLNLALWLMAGRVLPLASKLK